MLLKVRVGREELKEGMQFASDNHNFYFCLNLDCEKVGGDPGLDYVKAKLPEEKRQKTRVREKDAICIEGESHRGRLREPADIVNVKNE